jgi:hypothetical protein
VKISERLRRFWLPGSSVDRPLSEDERDWSHEHPANVHDELATTAERRAGGTFDPDDKKGT